MDHDYSHHSLLQYYQYLFYLLPNVFVFAEVRKYIKQTTE